MKKFHLWVHRDDPADLIVSKDSFPDVVVGDILEIYHPDKPRPVCLKVFSVLPPKGHKLQISVHWTVAEKFDLVNRRDVVARKVKPKDVCVGYVELSLKEVWASRGDQWNLRRALHGTCTYHLKTIRAAGVRAQVRGLYDQHCNPMDSGLITETTHFVFRSRASRFVIVIQMSWEMWQFGEHGDLFFERAVNGVMKDMFEHWHRAECNHCVTVLFCSRLHFPSGFKSPLVSYDVNGRPYKDIYKVLIEGQTRPSWDSVLVSLKQEFTTYPTLFAEAARLVGCETYENSTATQGNFLGALNLSIRSLTHHAWNDRDINRMGRLVVFITAGTGAFEVERPMVQVTKRRMIDSGVGCDLICVARPPLHIVPLFVFKQDPSVADAVYTIAHWALVSFSDAQIKDEKWRPLCRMTGVHAARPQAAMFVTPFLRGAAGNVGPPSPRRPSPSHRADNTTGALLVGASDVHTHPSTTESLSGSLFKGEASTLPEVPFDYRGYDARVFLFKSAGAGRAESGGMLRGLLDGDPVRRRDRRSSTQTAISRSFGETSFLEEVMSHQKPQRFIGLATPPRALMPISNGRLDGAGDGFTLERTSRPRSATTNVRLPMQTPGGLSWAMVPPRHGALATLLAQSKVTEEKSPRRAPAALLTAAASVMGPDWDKRGLAQRNVLFPQVTLNPFNPHKNVARVSSSRRRWAYVRGVNGRKDGDLRVTWKSLREPASLPLMTDFLPSRDVLAANYEVTHTMVTASDDSPALFNEMVAQRLAQGFQVVAGNLAPAVDPPDLPRSHMLEGLWLTKGDVIHYLRRLTDSVIVTRHVRRWSPSEAEEQPYRYLLWSSGAKRFQQVNGSISYVPISRYPWKYVDSLAAGNESALVPSINFWSMRFCLIPPWFSSSLDLSASARSQSFIPIGSEDAESVADADSGPDADRQTVEFFLRFIRAIESRPGQGQPFRLNIVGARLYKQEEQEALILDILQLMKAAIPLVDRTLHFKTYKSCFVGAESASWLSRSLRMTVDQAVTLGNRLLVDGIFVAANDEVSFEATTRHFYRFGPTVAPLDDEIVDDERDGWVAVEEDQQPRVKASASSLSLAGSIISPATPSITLMTGPDGALNLSRVQRIMVEDFAQRGRGAHVRPAPQGPPSPAVRRVIFPAAAPSPAPGAVLSTSVATPWVDVMYDTHYVPRACWHIELHWLLCSGALIEETVQLWNRKSRQVGLELVQVPAQNPPDGGDCLALPVDVPLADPALAVDSELLRAAILAAFGFVFDRVVDDSTMRFVHRTGTALVTLNEGGFMLLPNSHHKAHTDVSNALLDRFRSFCNNLDALAVVVCICAAGAHCADVPSGMGIVLEDWIEARSQAPTTSLVAMVGAEQPKKAEALWRAWKTQFPGWEAALIGQRDAAIGRRQTVIKPIVTEKAVRVDVEYVLEEHEAEWWMGLGRDLRVAFYHCQMRKKKF